MGNLQVLTNGVYVHLTLRLVFVECAKVCKRAIISLNIKFRASTKRNKSSEKSVKVCKLSKSSQQELDKKPKSSKMHLSKLAKVQKQEKIVAILIISE